MATPDDLHESLTHLEYEIAMMVATPRMRFRHPITPRFNKARPPGYYWNNDQAVAYLAAMESALTHARLLDDFFKCTARPRSGNKARDRYAFEYCVQSGWPGFEMLTSEEHDRIDKQLSHFTTRRAPRHGHALQNYAKQAIKALTLLTHHADTQWQPALQEIHAKAKAEQKRANDPWTTQ
ncbi:hypothetical protein [Mycobacterium gordonae]|uniref:Uncharacterized protein n=1 Tax=Mycobacterium gordonae TaxID=1778 RepID=A0A1X1X185_MYCGO|nr:hypothetical protein [Mycobacterium gordonae]MCV7008234.1 hypothetical protein [Mycobacterium gordonae]ODR16906.1 hypothetical protein BHQ23_28305 [Mycobacterium gordonae]ORV92636.1 hypothetical protein AWC08_19225 [Mycobacterium gordonae]